MISLARLVNDHGRALEYDLMTRTGHTLNDYMTDAAGRVALLSFIRYLPADSALYQAMNPKDEFGAWNTTMKTNAILADIFDVFVATHTKKGRSPKPYPRPKNHESIGKDAIPVSSFWDWWHKKDKRGGGKKWRETASK